MADFLDTLQRRVLLFDGAMGTQIHARDLTVEADFWGKENCSEVLNLARPDVIADIHLGYLRAGADAVETNTFGGPSRSASSSWRSGHSRSTAAAPSWPARRSPASRTTAGRAS